MVESRIEAITRALAATRERGGLMSLFGGMLLGGAVTTELSVPERAAARREKVRRRHGKPGHRGATGPAGPGGEPGKTGPQGPAGGGRCPAGTTFIGAVGCVETTSSGPVDQWTNAFTVCGNAGRRLPTANELYALRAIAGAASSVGLQPQEWTGEFTSPTMVWVAGSDPFIDPMPIDVSVPPFPYRCVEIPG